MVGEHHGGEELVGRLSQRTKCGQETLPEVRNWSETLPEVWNWSETISEVRNWSEDPPGGPEVWNWSGDPPGGPEAVERPSWRLETGRSASRRCASGRETLLEIRKWSGVVPEVWKW